MFRRWQVVVRVIGLCVHRDYPSLSTHGAKWQQFHVVCRPKYATMIFDSNFVYQELGCSCFKSKLDGMINDLSSK